MFSNSASETSAWLQVDKFQTSGTHRGTSRPACVYVWTACMVYSVHTRLLAGADQLLPLPSLRLSDVLIAQMTFITSYSLNIVTGKTKNIYKLCCFCVFFFSLHCMNSIWFPLFFLLITTWIWTLRTCRRHTGDSVQPALTLRVRRVHRWKLNRIWKNVPICDDRPHTDVLTLKVLPVEIWCVERMIQHHKTPSTPSWHF